MGRLFRSWFVWGFWVNVTALIIHIFFVPLYLFFQEHVLYKPAFYIGIQGVNSCIITAWFLMGLFWRFSLAGRIAAGSKIERGDLDTDAWHKKQADA